MIKPLPTKKKKKERETGDTNWTKSCSWCLRIMMVDSKGCKTDDNQKIAQGAADAYTGNPKALIHSDEAMQGLGQDNVEVDSKALSHSDANDSVNRTTPSSVHAYTCTKREKPESVYSDFDHCDGPEYIAKDSSSQVSGKVETSENLKNSVSEMELSAGNGNKVQSMIVELPKDMLVSEELSTVNGNREEIKSEKNIVPSLGTRKRKQLLTEEANQGLADALTGKEVLQISQVDTISLNSELDVHHDFNANPPPKSFLLDANVVGADESGTEEEQAAFIKELEAFHQENNLEFKHLRFYGEPLNYLKLWRAVIRLGGHEQVTSNKLWRQVGELFRPPKTCTTVSWTFRSFYEKGLFEYEKHKMRSGELPFSDASFSEPSSTGNQGNQALGSGRARRDAAARAMQGWHSQRLFGNGEIGDPIVKEKTSVSTPKREKHVKTLGLLKRKKLSPVDDVAKATPMKIPKTHSDSMITDIGAPADWVKINIQKTSDCFEVYALVPGLLREEVRVQSDPAGCLVISGQPEQLDNPWGVTPFKKVVSLPSRIDPLQTSAVVTLHGQLFVRVPFEQSDAY